jgi:uncharacterized repeat protein (TIGR01451 family)
MNERVRRFSFAGRRAVLGMFGSALAVALLTMGLLAPAGQAAAPPFIVFNPVLSSFGQIPPASSTTKTFTLKNSGGGATGPLSVVLVGSSTFKVTTDQCTGVSLASGKTCTVTVTYKPTAGGAHDFTTLWASSKKPVAVALAVLGGSSSATPVADLSITKTDGVTSVTPGNTTTYKIVVSNNGPSDVTGATVADPMPTGISTDSYTAVQTGGATGFTSGSGSISDTVNMPSGSTITYTVVATVSSTATPTLTLTNTATVTSPNGVTDPNPNNNSATDTDTIGNSLPCNSRCTVNAGSQSTGSVSVTATSTDGGTGTAQAAVFTGTLGCMYTGDQLHMDPNTYQVDVLSSSGEFSKTVAIEYPADASAPAISADTDPFSGNDGDDDYDDVVSNSPVCFQAPYSFGILGGGTAMVGLLPDCPATVASALGPCIEADRNMVTNPVSGTNYDINLTVFIPASEPGDPRMN